MQRMMGASGGKIGGNSQCRAAAPISVDGVFVGLAQLNSAPSLFHFRHLLLGDVDVGDKTHTKKKNSLNATSGEVGRLGRSVGARQTLV